MVDLLAPDFRRWVWIGIFSVMFCAFQPSIASAQGSSPAVAPAVRAAEVKKPPVALTQSTWKELTPTQRQALAPLATEWDKMGPIRKTKWLQITSNFPKMKPDEQLRIQDKMREWVKLTPDQRQIARENYNRAKKINPNQKSEKWQEYQELPTEEKKKLAENLVQKKQPSNLPVTLEDKNKPRPSLKSITRPSASANSASSAKLPQALSGAVTPKPVVVPQTETPGISPTPSPQPLLQPLPQPLLQPLPQPLLQPLPKPESAVSPVPTVQPLPSK